MRSRQQALFVSTILAAGLWLAGASAQNVIRDDPSNVGTGLKPQSGQINPGVGVQGPAGSPPGKNDQSGEGSKVTDRAPDVRDTAATNAPIPSLKEARAAFQQPLFKDPLPGEVAAPPGGPTPTPGDAQKVTGQGSMDPTGASAGHAAVGGAMSPGASAAASSGSSGSGSGTSGAGGQPAASGGAQPNAQAAAPPSQGKPQANGGDEPRMGPIGAIGQTMPAKFSKRNDTMDRLSTMGLPQAISDEERRQVYQAVMSDAAKPAGSDLGAIKVSDQLPIPVALNDMHPLPQSAAAMNGLAPYFYVKDKDKVLLVTPATRTVVDIIAAN